MRKTLIWGSLLPLLFLTQACLLPKGGTRGEMSAVPFMSFNIRMNYQDDGANNWEHRIDWITDMINHYAPGILGAQECYYPQYLDMKNRLIDYAAFGPVDGRQGAESVALFYRKDSYKLLDSGTFWLSETPEIQSVGWDANLRRTVTWGRFQIRSSGISFFAFVTHFDHKGDIAREASVNLLQKKVSEIAVSEPAIIMGDFNIKPTSKFYNLITNGAGGQPGFYDTYAKAGHTYGPDWTVNAFGLVPQQKRGRIDYIFCNQRLTVEQYVNIAEQRGDIFLSDHNPQLAIIKL